jgi:hypothetical protein
VTATVINLLADHVQISLPGFNAGAPYNLFTTGMVGGTPSVGINGNLIINGTISASMIHAGAIQAVHIAAGSIDASKIQAGSISTAQLAVGGVSLANIIAGAVSNTQVFGTPTLTNVTSTTVLINQNMDIQSGAATVTMASEWQCQGVQYGGLRPSSAIQFVIDGNVVRQFSWAYFGAGAANAYELFTSFTVQHTQTGPPPGSHNFQLRAVTNGNMWLAAAGRAYITDFRR